MVSQKFTNLSQFNGIVHGYSTTEFGNMSFRYSDKDTVIGNRHQFFESLNVNESQIAVTSLVHGNQIIDVTKRDWGRGIEEAETSLEGDVLVTSEPDTNLFMVVADCLALFFYEPDKHVCALAHAGWRGVDLEVPRLTVEYLVKQKGCDPKKLVVGMPPALQKESSIYQEFEKNADPRWQKYINVDQVDWTGYAYDQLLKAGVLEKNIERSTVDTRLDKNYFSHRRSVEENDKEARFGCLIGLKKEL